LILVSITINPFIDFLYHKFKLFYLQWYLYKKRYDSN